jgi:Protein of unknown function (DUF2795)
MNDYARTKPTPLSTPAIPVIACFLSRADFPATGSEMMRVVQARHGPEDLLAALRRLTPAKVFHNVYEAWYDALDGAARPRAAMASSEASRLSRL